MSTFTGMNLRGAISAARGLNCDVRHARRTGELVVETPDGERTRLNCRRKDAPRHLTTILNQLSRKNESTGPQVEAESTDSAMVKIASESMSMNPEPTPEPDTTPPSPVPAREPPLTGSTPLEQLRGFREWRDLITADAKAQLSELETERANLAGLLAEADGQIAELRSELRAVGIFPTTPLPMQRLSTMANIDDNLPTSVRAYEYLAARPGIWVTASELKHRISTDMQVGMALRSYVDDRSVEKRGQNRGTQYRFISNIND